MQKMIVGVVLLVFCSCVLAETDPPAPAGGSAAGAGASAGKSGVPNSVWFVVGVVAAAALAASGKSSSTTSH